jgi:hypothetical protein
MKKVETAGQFIDHKNIIAAILLLITCATLGLVWHQYASIERGRDAALESQIIVKMRMAKNAGSGLTKIKLPASSSGKLCFQSPYMTRKGFEAATGQEVENFAPILDDLYIWWIIDGNGKSSWIRVPRVSIADKDQNLQPACFDLKIWGVTLQCDQNCIYSMRRR